MTHSVGPTGPTKINTNYTHKTLVTIIKEGQLREEGKGHIMYFGKKERDTSCTLGRIMKG